MKGIYEAFLEVAKEYAATDELALMGTARRRTPKAKAELGKRDFGLASLRSIDTQQYGGQ